MQVTSLKLKIEEKSGVPANEQHIVFGGELLKDGSVLAGVQENDQITLLKKVSSFHLFFPSLISFVLATSSFHLSCS